MVGIPEGCDEPMTTLAIRFRSLHRWLTRHMPGWSDEYDAPETIEDALVFMAGAAGANDPTLVTDPSNAVWHEGIDGFA